MLSNNNRCIAECRKFSPNIFNKNKCTLCFGKREEHNPAALDYNRASRKVSKCGYLFVAPHDWDWDNPLYRTKRWQRRWFVLFDDGELTYSVDDHPETIPQASINMSDVIEVADAEQITGHINSILIQTPDRSTFVKGTCQEESRWWYNVLVQLVKSKVRHHKRNAFLVKGHQNQKFYNDQPISISKSPPTRDKLQPENKAQVRGRSRETDTTDSPTALFYDDVIREEKLKDIANKITNLSTQEKDRKNRWTMSDVQLVDETPTRDDINNNNSINSSSSNGNCKQKRPQSLSIVSSTPSIISVVKKKLPASSPTTEIINYRKGSSQPQQQSHERGDPDGDCGMEDSTTSYCSKTVELRVKLPSEEILNSKSGWLMKQDNPQHQDWSKYWFSLKGGGLFYYRDPSAEERGVLDGVLDVNSITSIKEITSNRNHAFQLTTWDNKRLNLSAVTSNVKNNWINALRNASGLVDNAINQVIDENNSNTTNDVTSASQSSSNGVSCNRVSICSSNGSKKLEMPSFQDENGISVEKKPKHSLVSPVTPIHGRPIHFSSDDEYKTASEGGRRESIDWGSPLSPSNPIQITLSHAKENKIRSNLRNNLHKRSLSSPPTSRRSTMESVDDFHAAIKEEQQQHIATNVENEMKARLMASEQKISMMHEEARERDTRISELVDQLESTERELSARKLESEEVKKKLLAELMENHETAQKVITDLSVELVDSKNKIVDVENKLQRGIEENDSLYRKIRHMESTVPSTSSASTTSLTHNSSKAMSDRVRRMDSFSDLTCINDVDPDELDKESLVCEYQELKERFEKVVNELKMMKRELRESYSSYDNLDLAHSSLRQDCERKHNEHQLRTKMMAERIQDLTNKYSSAEKQVRVLKQKLMKSERKRTSSLKGKETLQLQKELEEKVVELEGKFEINPDVEMASASCSLRASPSRCETPEKRGGNSTARLRRKSLDSVSSQPMQLLVRLNALEKKLENSQRHISSSNLSLSTVSSDSTAASTNDQLKDCLRYLENVIASSRTIIDDGLQQLHQFNKSKSRHDHQSSTTTVRVEQLLAESVKILTECQQPTSSALAMTTMNTTTTAAAATTSTAAGTTKSSTSMEPHQLPTGDEMSQETSLVKASLLQLEAQLKAKLTDLLKQRRILRETNKLTHKKDLELLAERLAFESVCFGKLRDSLCRADIQLDKFVEHQTKCEIAETTQLMAMLKAKLCGKAMPPQTGGSLDVLSQVLARRLLLTASKMGQSDMTTFTTTGFPTPSSIVNSNFIEDLLRQQNELSLITKRYKINAIENLAYDLAAETLNYISANSSVQGAVQEAWRYAQETVNAELIQYEISHIMKKTAKRYENSMAPSFGYALTSQERISFEVFADAVQDSLRKEMEITIAQLTQCYEDNLNKMKQGQWRIHLEQERKASEGRQLLIEFADIVAQKALVDARIAVIRGDVMHSLHSPAADDKDSSSSYGQRQGLAKIQKYENLFLELADDMDMGNADDILAEADFNFMFKNFVFTYAAVNKQEMNDLSNVIIKLEELLIQLHNRASNPDDCITQIQNLNLDNIKNISLKLNEFQEIVEKILFANKIAASCQECEKMQEALLAFSTQQDEEVENMKRAHSEMIMSLNERIEEHLSLTKKLRYELSSMESVCVEKSTQCESLIQQLSETNEKCWQYKNRVDELVEKLNEDKVNMIEIKANYDRLCEQFKHELDANKELESRIDSLENDHSQKIEDIHQYYQDRQSHPEQRSSYDEDDLQLKYQCEIEQLRTLCEKGLSAMESSHKRIVSEMDIKHKEEIERLLREKEVALAEETQATLQALESMRKAHQNEVQREVQRFKQEFLRQINSDNRDHFEAIAAQKEEKELEEVRQEILSLSEKYSLKCVEAIALEEKLRGTHQKLRQAHQVIKSLEVKSKHPLRADDELEHDSLNSSLNSIEPVHVKPESLPTSPIASRDLSKEAIFNLPLIPIAKIRTEFRPRSILSDGSKSSLSPKNDDETSSSSPETPSSPSAKEMERSFELEI